MCLVDSGDGLIFGGISVGVSGGGCLGCLPGVDCCIYSDSGSSVGELV